MVRMIKRYESRKLYDTEESRYVALDEIAGFVRDGQDVRVVDNGSGEDVTAQTLTQVILEEGRSGRAQLPTELLHDLVRRGEKALANGVEQAKQGVDRLVQASFDKLGPVKRAREEMDVLRERMEDLEASLVSLSSQGLSGDTTSPTRGIQPMIAWCSPSGTRCRSSTQPMRTWAARWGKTRSMPRS